jgi:hypothetical protein
LLESRASTLAVALGDDAKVQLDVSFDFSPQSPAPETQKAVKKALVLLERELKRLLAAYRKDMPPQVSLLLEQVEAGLERAGVNERGGTVVTQLRLDTNPNTLTAGLQTLVSPVFFAVRGSSERTLGANNLRQIALALHAYAQDHEGRLPPPAIYGKDGKALLSWRVAILPYLEMNDLYKEFKLDEPWDSAHNIKLLERMPQVFTVTKHKAETHYQVLVGTGAAFEGAKGISLSDFPDGSSNTILVVEASPAVPWTKPADVTFDPKGPLPRLGGPFPDGYHIALVDTTIHFLRSADPEVLRGMILRNDGRGAEWEKIKK